MYKKWRPLSGFTNLIEAIFPRTKVDDFFDFLGFKHKIGGKNVHGFAENTPE